MFGVIFASVTDDVGGESNEFVIVRLDMFHLM